jgi:hypothetical protein
MAGERDELISTSPENEAGRTRRGLRILCCREYQNSIAESSKQTVEDALARYKMAQMRRCAIPDYRGRIVLLVPSPDGLDHLLISVHHGLWVR